jgi:hypothetical protein
LAGGSRRRFKPRRKTGGFSIDSINKEDLPNPLKSRPHPTWELKKHLKFLLKTGGILRFAA